MQMCVFAFDFSMNKPAMCFYDGKSIEFFAFPISIDKKSEEMLSEAGVHVFNRPLGKIRDEVCDENELIIGHVTRASNLSDLIISKMKECMSRCGATPSSCIVSNEGISFGSRGDAMLDLSGYKYILMFKLINMGFTNLRTYSPMTIKSVAGCAKRGMGKDDMIKAVGQDEFIDHKFIRTIREHPEKLKKKTSFVTCTDDLADSYWCLRTTIKKEDML